jgi:aspartyl-tRNA(Asn)/glutamyl-tRNA(Gln) amidotransferase subunit B
VCLGYPGSLPVINREAVRHVLATGLAIGGKIPEVTRWDRKNYFYPDLPKGYQISQYDLPLTSGGSLTFDTSQGAATVEITRAHLEEDTARLQHRVEPDGRSVSLVDFNRSGTPLMEIVTEPVIRTAEVARRYAEELRLLLVTIGASDAAMENGQMRVEANVSLRPVGQEAFGTRVEVKNMNSFRSVERAIAYEIERQEHALRNGDPLMQETRGWDDDRGITYRMRVKETSDDYRYFPEPDLPPLRVDAAWLAEIQAALPELPAARRTRYQSELGLSAYDADVIVAAAGVYFDSAIAATPSPNPKKAANLLSKIGLRLQKTEPDLLSRRDGIELARVVALVDAGALSSQNAEQVYEQHLRTGEGIDAIIASLGLRQISDDGPLRDAITRVLAANPAAVADVAAGKNQVFGFLTGQVMKETRGQANAARVAALLREMVGERPAG